MQALVTDAAEDLDIENCLSHPRMPLLIVAAHPDDEVIGAGAQLSSWQQAHIIHVTNGAPRSMTDAIAAGFSSREEYARARRGEAEAALALAAIPASRLDCLGFVDQETSLGLDKVVLSLCAFLKGLRPRLIITHPYEGGHPGHDATAFAIQAACHLLAPQLRYQPLRIEMGSYHNSGGRMATGEFLPWPGQAAIAVELTAAQQEFKRRLFGCFTTQKQVLSCFSLAQECFRLAPTYDFCCPPHSGQLYYEMFNWGMTGLRWRALARKALQKLGFRKGVMQSTHDP